MEVDLGLPGIDEGGLDAGEEEGGEDAGEGEGVGEELVLPVDDDEGNEEEAEDGECEMVEDVFGDRGREAEVDVMGEVEKELEANGEDDEPEGGSELDQGVLDVDGGFAGAAAGAEEKPAEDGDVVVPADGGGAGGAVGAGGDDAFAARNAEDQDVEEAAEEQAQGRGLGG